MILKIYNENANVTAPEPTGISEEFMSNITEAVDAILDNLSEASLIDDEVKFNGIKIACTIDNKEFCTKDLPVIKKNWKTIEKKAIEKCERKDITKGQLKLKSGKYDWNSKDNVATFTFNFDLKGNKDATLSLNVFITNSEITGYGCSLKEVKVEEKKG